MGKKEDPLMNAFDTFREVSEPTTQQKEKMLHMIHAKAEEEERSGNKVYQWITTYPWRFALLASLAQTVIGTVAFGSGYSRFFFQLIGG